MNKLKVLLTGATGTMGQATLNLLLEEDMLDVTVMALDTAKEKRILKSFLKKKAFSVIYGDVRDFEAVFQATKETELILHLAALVSPAADKHPDLAMQINCGGTLNFVQAITKQKRQNEVFFVYIGTVAQTGDRRPPIHWGRVGDPIKPAVFDYYAVSKVAAERAVIESGLTNWVSLRQTGIMGPDMGNISDPIILHNPLDNVLEYVSDRDSSILLRNLCVDLANNQLDPAFWGHIYNVGGGESCRASSLDLYSGAFAKFGITDLKGAFNPNWFATYNFHGQYYLDSDKLENYLHFRNDTMQYFYDSFEENNILTAKLGRHIMKLPGAQKLIKSMVANKFKRLALKTGGTLYALKKGKEDYITTFWGNLKNWLKLPADFKEFKPFNDYQKVIRIDHGYDEDKPASELNLADIRYAAKFRGGSCLSSEMEKGNWKQKLLFRCGFGHNFKASPKLILEGGHWCPYCENAGWNYTARAKIDPFFAQVWNPIHKQDENKIAFAKTIKPKLTNWPIKLNKSQYQIKYQRLYPV
ncbi:MAG: NAD(P)-dependent oxidoreductase [Clostridiaceae bacterium]|nr:NAD(P)-dependent oxidoreductase [Clostridiaceae bacterium]